MYEAALIQAGLNPEQAAVYEVLLKTGPSPARKIAQNTPYKRTLVYKILEDLQKQGLVTRHDEVGKVSVFEPAHPLKLKELAEKKEEQARSAQTALEGILGQLTSDYNLISGRPGVKFYEGSEGVMRMHREILQENKEIRAYVVINKEWDQPLKTFWDWYYKERLRRGIKVRSITVDDEEGKKYQAADQKYLRETRLVPKDKFPFEIEKNIFGNKVAYLSLKPGQQVAILVDNDAIAKTERSIFELAWERAGGIQLSKERTAPSAPASAP